MVSLQLGGGGLWGGLCVLTLFATLRGGVAGSCSHLNDCSGHGTCDEATRTCSCFTGFGAAADTALYKAPDCSMRTCPAGRAWADVPSGSTTAHAMAECSNAGICDRGSGRCRCFAGFEGDACQRSACPNSCSGHGRCVPLSQMASERNALPLRAAVAYGGNEATTTWDENKIFGCVCDSTWVVGFGAHETQTTSWFGPDCSLRHCPSGDDPDTSGTGKNETDCRYYRDNGASWMGTVDADGDPDFDDPASGISSSLAAGTDFGAQHNLCHVDCSNRGICDHASGLCKCFRGYYGENCALRDANARGEA